MEPKWAKLFAFSDVVSVVSKDCAVFLDPLKGYLQDLLQDPNQFWLSLSSKDLSKKWPDQFGPFETGLQHVFSGEGLATVVRLPLRAAKGTYTEKQKFQEVLHKQIYQARI